MTVKHGEKLAEGKTKIIWADPAREDVVLIESRDDITAGNGAKRHVIPGKGILSTTTTSNCFQLLNLRRVPTHYLERVSPNMFRALRVEMIPIELVARAIATGSFLKRNPNVREGTIFKDWVIEYFFKDDARHDPMMVWNREQGYFSLYSAKEPMSIASYMGTLPKEETQRWLPEGGATLNKLTSILRSTFTILGRAWRDQDVSLVDLKIECGFATLDGSLVIADVIDNDSWRIWPGGKKTQMKDKQVYRDTDEMTPEASEAIRRNYEWVADATEQFFA